jgi:hypothetical protein
VNQRAYFITEKIRHVAVIIGKGEGNISRPSVDERVNNLGWIVGENFHGILHRSCQSPALATGKHVPRYAPASSSAVTTSATGRCRVRLGRWEVEAADKAHAGGRGIYRGAFLLSCRVLGQG